MITAQIIDLILTGFIPADCLKEGGLLVSAVNERVEKALAQQAATIAELTEQRDVHDRHSVALMQQRKEQAATISQYEVALDDIIHARDFGEALNVARRVMGSCPKEGHPKEQS